MQTNTPAVPPSKKRLLVADLSGSAWARGARHAELAKDLVEESGAIPFFRDFCESQLPPKARIARLWVRSLHRLVARRFSSEQLDLIAGFASASHLSERDLKTGMVMPDVLNYLLGVSHGLAGMPTLGCTSIAAWGDMTAGGALVYGRTLDFVGAGYFDRSPIVCRHKPSSGIPYVSVGTAGAVADGIVGINEEGLTVAPHQHISADKAILRDGRPILDLCRHILQNCRTLKEAVLVCASWKTTSAWSIVMTSHKERKACAVERTPRHSAARFYENGRMVRTNTFSDPILNKSEFDYPGFSESSRMRALRAEQILDASKGGIDALTIASALNDHYDPERKKIRAFTQTIAQPHNVLSVVFEPEKGRVWVSEGTAPVCEGPFREVPLWEKADPKGLMEGLREELAPDQKKASRRYLEAISAWDRRDPGACLASLDRAVALDPEESMYRYMQGLMALKCGQPKKAAQTLASGANLPDIPHRAQAQTLWMARALELCGRREDSRRVYESLTRVPMNAALKRAAEKDVRSPFTPKKLAKTVPDLIFGDATY